MSDADLAYMMDPNESFELPRWNDPLSSTAQAAHAAQAYYSSNIPPPPSALPPTSPQRISITQSATGPSRQPRISQLLDQEQQMGLPNLPYLSTNNNQLARSASLGGGATNNQASSRNRRHHQPGDLEGNFTAESQPMSASRSHPPPPQNSFYPPSVAYQPQSLTGANAVNTPTSTSTINDTYHDMYYGTSPVSSQTMNRVHSTPETASRATRSPMRGPNTPNLLDPYSPQHTQYSPPTSAYAYGPPTDQRAYQPHNRNHSQQVKTESLSPALHTAQGYTQPYAMESNSPHPSSQQSHLGISVRKSTSSNPSTPLSYMPSQSPSYYIHDQPMAVDPPPRKRAAGFQRVRGARDLQPKLDVPVTSRRMDGDTYLSPLRQLTTNIVDLYRICNPQFRYESTHNPRRVLTKPSKPSHNDGYDNEDYDYILYVNDWLGTEEGHKYLILDILGQGTFGQVVKCQNMKTHEIVAVKVVKNKPAYFNQSMMEVTILDMLNKTCDPNDEHHILRLRDSFIHRSHLCLVFELLSSNLYELIKQNQFQGLSTQLVKVFMAQLLDALTVLKEARLIHCDLKPENILLKSLQSPQIKVIDFGSACHERQTVYTYIQSRFYRSPEVLLGMSYTASIDMWSLGCIAVELFLGLPLFPGTSEYNQLTRIVEMLGLPPMSMLNTGKQTSQFFDSQETWNPHTNQNEKKYRLKSIEQYAREHNTNEQPGKQYFKATTLPEIINAAPMPSTKSSRTGHEVEKELNNRASFIDFCKGLLDMNPVTRWTPQQARLHPFITGEKFMKPFVPDGFTAQPTQPSPSTDPKRPYGGLVPSQPKGARAYQDAASYNQHLAQHQVHTAQVQSQASATLRNPYMTQNTSQSNNPAYAGPPESAPPYPTPQTYSASQPPSGHRLTHQSSSGQLTANNSNAQYSGAPVNGPHLASGVPSNTYYGGPRGRANTINQMDTVPPALARLQHMNQDVIAGRNALTPVLNRDDAMKEWERRQSGKAAATQPYPQLEYLQQQAEIVGASGLNNWSAVPSHRYHPPTTSKLAHAFNPQSMVVDDDQGRRDAMMSNVRTAARGEGSNAALYGQAGVISNPPQVYTASTTTSGNRYTATYPQQQASGQPSGAGFDLLDRRTDMGNMYAPMQPDAFTNFSNQTASNNANRHVAPPQQAMAPAFYGAGMGANPSNNNRNVFDAPTQPPLQQGARRGSDVDNWPR